VYEVDFFFVVCVFSVMLIYVFFCDVDIILLRFHRSRTL
jgi:hypothetical protein